MGCCQDLEHMQAGTLGMHLIDVSHVMRLPGQGCDVNDGATVLDSKAMHLGSYLQQPLCPSCH